MKPILSIIIPAYNAENFINRAIISIIDQPLASKIEILIIDDGSIDNTYNLTKFSVNNNFFDLGIILPKIHIIHQNNGGVSSARHTGIKNSNGKYLAFLDSDDFWEKDFFNNDICSILEKYNYDLLKFSYSYVNQSFTYEKVVNVVENDYAWESRKTNKSIHIGHFSSFIYKRDLINNNNCHFLPVKVNEDTPFIQQCIYFASSCKVINKQIFCYWNNNKSCTNTINPIEYYNNKLKSFVIQKEWYEQNGTKYDISFDVLTLISSMFARLCQKMTKVQIQQLFNENNDVKTILEKGDLSSIGIKNKITRRIIIYWRRCPYVL